jgi:hypothetical protein
MEPWIAAREKYIASDIALVEYVPQLVTEEILFRILGKKVRYPITDAMRIQKNQLTRAQYEARMDRTGGFSAEAMVRLLRERCAYLVARGATLNNPHINAEYFSGKKGAPGTDRGPGSWVTLDLRQPKEHLRDEVRKALKPPRKAQIDRVKREAEELSIALASGKEEP